MDVWQSAVYQTKRKIRKKSCREKERKFSDCSAKAADNPRNQHTKQNEKRNKGVKGTSQREMSLKSNICPSHEESASFSRGWQDDLYYVTTRGEIFEMLQ